MSSVEGVSSSSASVVRQQLQSSQPSEEAKEADKGGKDNESAEKLTASGPQDVAKASSKNLSQGKSEIAVA